MRGLRVELALVVGIFVFCCWCGYIILNMNLSVSSGSSTSTLWEERRVGKQLLGNNSHLAAAISKLPAGQYVIREQREELGSQVRPSQLTASWKAAPGQVQSAEIQEDYPADYSSSALNQDSAQSPQPQFSPAPEAGEAVGESSGAGKDLLMGLREQPDPSDSEEPEQEEAEAAAGGDSATIDEDPAEASPDSAPEAEADPQSEYEERSGSRSFSEDQSESNERDKDGAIVRRRKRLFVNGRPVVADDVEPPAARRADEPAGRGPNNSSGGLETLKGAAASRKLELQEPARLSDNARDHPPEAKANAGAAGPEDQVGAVFPASVGPIDGRKPGRVSPPDWRQTSERQSYSTSRPLQRALPAVERNISSLSPADSRHGFSARSGEAAGGKLEGSKSFRGSMLPNSRREEDIEEIDENSKDSEPKRRRNSQRHKLRESLQASHWDDQSENPKVIGKLSEQAGESAEARPEEEPVEFEDLDLLVDSNKFPFPDRRRKRSLGASEGGSHLGQTVKFDDEEENERQHRDKEAADKPAKTSGLVLTGATHLRSAGKSYRLNGSEVEASGKAGVSKGRIIVSSVARQVPGRSQPDDRLMEPMNSGPANSSSLKTGQDQRAINSTGAAKPSSSTKLLTNDNDNEPEEAPGSLPSGRLEAQEDLAVEVLARRPGQPDGNGSFLISQVPELPPLASQHYYNPLPAGEGGSPRASSKQIKEQPAPDYKLPYLGSGSKSSGKRVKYMKKSKLYEGKQKASKAFKSKKRSKLRKGGMKKRKTQDSRKYAKKYKDFSGATRGKKGKRGYGKKGGKKGKLYYMDQGYKKRGFKKNYQKFETGDHKTYFDEFRNKDHSKKWKDFRDKHHYSQSKKWSGRDKKKYKNYNSKAASGRKHGYGSWREKEGSKSLKRYKHKKEFQKKARKKKQDSDEY